MLGVGLILTLFLVMRLYIAWPFTQDDAYITMRYAQNWLEFSYLGWNLDDEVPVEGYSNTLYLLIIYTAMWCDISAELVVKWVSVISLLFMLPVIYLFLRRLQGGYSLLSFYLISTSLGVVYWAVSGLETFCFVI